MRRIIKKNDNFLALVPRKSEDKQWQVDSDGLVEIIIKKEGVLDKIVRLFMATPKVMRIRLDRHGSCVWKAIDGRRSIQEIGVILEEEFGEKVNPLYERLVTFICILRNNRFIILDKR